MTSSTPKLLYAITLLATVAAQAQNPAPAPAPGRIIGEVTAIDARANRISVKPDKGDPATVVLDEKTSLLRVPPGEKDLKKAVRIALADVVKGDRVLAAGQASPDQRMLAARSVVIMSQAEIAQKHQLEREEWQRRGVTGTVVSVDASGKSLVIAAHTLGGPKPIALEVSAATDYWRYAPDSVKFSDAKISSLAEVKVGDQVRVLGDKSADGGTVKAEQIVSGSFRQLAGTVISVNAEAGEIRITDLANKKPVTVTINADSALHRLSPTLAAMMARRAQNGEPSAGDRAQRTPRPEGQPGQGTGDRPQMSGGGGPGGGRGNGDIQQMLERMPAFALTELKPGDALIVTSTTGTDPSRVTAIGVVAGVEPLLTATPGSSGQVGGAWSFGEIGLPE